MARLPYGEDQSIHSMNARQLRQYIADKATEAQKRLNDVPDLKETSRAFQDLAGDITGRGGKVKRSTSYMSVPEMREYAYQLRQFNSFDKETKFSKTVEWKENKERYKKFMQAQFASTDKEVRDYWSKYKTPSGNVSTKGFNEYMKYRLFLENIENIKEKFGYSTLKSYYREANTEFDKKALERILLKVFADSKYEGKNPDQLNDAFVAAWEDYKSSMKPAAKKPVVKKPKKRKAPASKQNIKTKQGRKMRTSAKVSEKLT